MPRFAYKAKKGPTEIVQGEIDADSEDAAIGKISALGLVPVKLQSSGGEAAAPSVVSPGIKISTPVSPIPGSQRAKTRVPHSDLSIFTRQFAILLKASVPLFRIFDILQIQTKSLKFRQVLVTIQEELRQGASLSEALAQYPKVFSQIYVSMIHSGEVSGTLDKVLMRLSEFAEKEEQVRAKVQAALVYPAFLALMGVATVFVLLTFVMPRLMSLFTDMGTQLPLITRIIIKISRFCQAYWIFIVAGSGLSTFLLRSKGLSPAQKKAIDAFLLKLPLIGRLIEKAETARFLRSMELLYENGIPLFKAVEVGARTVGNSMMQEALAKVPGYLEGGETLARSLSQVPSISPFVIHMVSVGEESGQLGAAVRETASFYEQETEQFIKITTSLLEPLMILIIGLVVGFIVIAMLLPIFDLQALAQ